MKHPTILLGLIFALVGLAPLACSDSGKDDEGKGGSGGNTTCVADTDCSGGLVCGPTGSCVECAGDGNCPRAQRCDPGLLSCVFREGWGEECTSHEECSLGMFCVQGLCTPGELTTQCGALGQCPEGMKCNRSLQVCEENLGCFSNADCLEDEACNPGTGKCEQRCTVETEQEVCGLRQHCADGRCVECAADADCGPGLVCNVTAGRCAGAETCFTDRDCAAGKICNRATSTCTTPPPPCDSDDDCLPDERCDLARGRCNLAACQPDQDEPNDEQAAAVTITAGDRLNLTVCGALDEDWYRIALNRGDRVNVNVEADVLVAGGLNVQLRDGTGRVLDEDSLLLDTTVSQDGDYFLRVRTQDEQARYALHVLVVRGVPCDDDDLEENDGAVAASPISMGTRENLQICPADRDWYVVEVPAGRGVTARLSHDPLQGDLDLVIYDSDGKTQLGASRTTTAVETVQIPGVSGGRAYVLVTPSSDRTQNAYDLTIAAE